MPWDTVVAALLVLAATFAALAASLGLALLFGGRNWPQAQGDDLRWSGAVSTQLAVQRHRPVES